MLAAFDTPFNALIKPGILTGIDSQSWYTKLANEKAKKKADKSKKAPSSKVIFKTGARSRTPRTDDMRKKTPKRTCSSNTDDEEKRLECKKLKEELTTTKELYEGQKALATVAQTSLEKEKRKRTKIENGLKAELKAAEEKYERLLESRISEHNEFVNERLSTFGQAGLGTLLKPGYDILRGKQPKVTKIIDVAADNSDEDMEKESENKGKQNDVSCEETANVDNDQVPIDDEVSIASLTLSNEKINQVIDFLIENFWVVTRNISGEVRRTIEANLPRSKATVTFIRNVTNTVQYFFTYVQWFNGTRKDLYRNTRPKLTRINFFNVILIFYYICIWYCNKPKHDPIERPLDPTNIAQSHTLSKDRSIQLTPISKEEDGKVDIAKVTRPEVRAFFIDAIALIAGSDGVAAEEQTLLDWVKAQWG